MQQCPRSISEWEKKCDGHRSIQTILSPARLCVIQKVNNAVRNDECGNMKNVSQRSRQNQQSTVARRPSKMLENLCVSSCRWCFPKNTLDFCSLVSTDTTHRWGRQAFRWRAKAVCLVAATAAMKVNKTHKKQGNRSEWLGQVEKYNGETREEGDLRQ